MVRSKGFRIAAVVLLVVAYLVIYRMAAMGGGSAMILPTPQERVPFTVDFLGNVVLSVPGRDAVHERTL